MEKTLSSKQTKHGIDRNALRLWGLLFLTLGLFGRGILQCRVLGVGNNVSLLEVLNQSGGMTAAATALALEAVESCAVPIFSVLLIEGFEKTSSFRRYFLRLLATAVLCELPYNFAMSARWFNPGISNPVFSNLLCLISLYFYRQYRGTSFKNILVKLLVLVSGVFWSLMLRIDYGICMLLVVTVLWFLRNRSSLRTLMGAAVAVCCCVGRPLTMFSPFGFLVVHLYNGEEGLRKRLFTYSLYPLILLLVGLAGWLLF